MNTDPNKEQLAKRVADLEAEVHELEKDLIHDSLTGLKTRAFFEEEAKTYLEFIKNPGQTKRKEWFGFKNLSFLFFDIDHFKKINDEYGHNTGDVVLRRVAITIGSQLRDGDTAARWGGEEIVVSLLGANEEDAYSKADGIRKEVEKLTFTEDPTLKVTISCGVATAVGGVPFEAIIKRADEALYKAKDSGRNTVVRYSELNS